LRLRGLATQSEGDVLQYAKVREERIVLKHKTDASPLGRNGKTRAGHACSIDADGAAVDIDETGDRAQQRGLATAGTAHHATDVATRQRQRQSLDDRRARLIGDGQVLNGEYRNAQFVFHSVMLSAVARRRFEHARQA
jgi:hypothetical protein